MEAVSTLPKVFWTRRLPLVTSSQRLYVQPGAQNQNAACGPDTGLCFRDVSGAAPRRVLHSRSWEAGGAGASLPGFAWLPSWELVVFCVLCSKQPCQLTCRLLCLPRGRSGSCHGALPPLPREVLRTESPQHLRPGAWAGLRETTLRGAHVRQGLPAPAGGGCPPGPSPASVCLQELPRPVLPLPRPPQVLPAESQRVPDESPEALRTVGTLSFVHGGVLGLSPCVLCCSQHRDARWEPVQGEAMVQGQQTRGSPVWLGREARVGGEGRGGSECSWGQGQPPLGEGSEGSRPAPCLLCDH